MLKSLRRHIMMQQGGKHYNVDWYPIIQGDMTTAQLIADYGDLFQTFDDAPETYGGKTKLGAKALNRNVTSIQVGHNVVCHIIIMEEGYPPIYVPISSALRTITFHSDTTYKHIVFYSTNETGNQAFNAAVWQIGGLWYDESNNIRYLHIPRYSTNSINVYRTERPDPRGYAGSTYFIPDWWSGTIFLIRFTQFQKIRFSKGCTLFKSMFFMGGGPSENAALRDIYCHWGLGEVKQQYYSRGVYRNVKLHIPDLGNAEDNTALVAEYRSKGWNYLSGAGIYNDVETTEPQEQDSI